MITSDINKSGELFLQTVLERSKRGIKLTIYGSAKLEKFMSDMNNNMPLTNTRVFGREWLFAAPATGDAYNVSGEDFIGARYIGGGKHCYRLDTLGKPLFYYDDSIGMKVINLSFVRLVGISSGGVSFEIPSVRSKESIKEISTAIAQATRAFYEQYVQDVKQVITVSEMSVPAANNIL